MEEKRKYQRTEVNEPAYVSSGGSVMRCTVRNISPEGAAIDVDEPAFVPARFRLVMANDPTNVRECRVAWIQKNRIGLTFVDCHWLAFQQRLEDRVQLLERHRALVFLAVDEKRRSRSRPSGY